MTDFERLGVFYLGREYDPAARQASENLLLYDSKDLTTHAVCVGMTGSGKTGLCLALLEEAGIDNIPAIIIDPKGDLGNLLLTFPDLRPADFEPWIDPAEATRAGVTPQELAATTAKRWQDGLAATGQGGERIRRLREAVDIAIYTPGSNIGLPLAILRSLTAPPQSTLDDGEALRDAVSAATSALLGLLGIDADPLQSREHILIGQIVERHWRDGKGLDIPGLIRAIQTPGFDKVGVVDLESFFPAKQRHDLAMRLNNLFASPAFAAWTEGEPLDIQRLLYTDAGKPRLAILSIAHLSDAERMFFVTTLLSETLSWMRTQPGTSSLRAILYMDEVFGYFPPSSNPPSKRPMLTLLKQARAFGLGIVLATQNPVDLDYKGLSNCGTWFLGRLQTERDKMRVLDGLEGASAAAGAAFDRGEMDQILSGLGNRVFLLNNVHEDHPVVFQTRWALSYLRGPLSREQISRLMSGRKTQARSASELSRSSTAQHLESGNRPILPPGITEQFAPRRANVPAGGNVLYRPALGGRAKVHFTQAAGGIDHWQELWLCKLVENAEEGDAWSAAETVEEAPDLESQAEPDARFATLPADLAKPKRYSSLATALKDHLYRNQKLSLWKCAAFKKTSAPEESEAAFRARLSQLAREERDAQVETLRKKYATKLVALEERIRKAQIKVDKEKSQATEKTLSAALSIGSSILGALFSRKLTSTGNVSRATTSMRQATRIARERQDITDANESVQVLSEQLAEMNAALEAEISQIQTELAPDKLPLEPVALSPKKSEIQVSAVNLVWMPWIVREDGVTEPAV